MLVIVETSSKPTPCCFFCLIHRQEQRKKKKKKMMKKATRKTMMIMKGRKLTISRTKDDRPRHSSLDRSVCVCVCVKFAVLAGTRSSGIENERSLANFGLVG